MSLELARAGYSALEGATQQGLAAEEATVADIVAQEMSRRRDRARAEEQRSFVYPDEDEEAAEEQAVEEAAAEGAEELSDFWLEQTVAMDMQYCLKAMADPDEPLAAADGEPASAEAADEGGDGQEEPEASEQQAEDGEGEAEGGTVFVGKSLLDSLRAAAAAGTEPSRADLVRLFDTDALPEEEALEAVDASGLGASFEADPPKAIDALVTKHGAKEVFQLILEAHAVLNDDADSEDGQDDAADSDVCQDEAADPEEAAAADGGAADPAEPPPEKKPRVA
ncbi:unnamed protein product [Prorocentrum cordatum]|uniref:Uncharacterized protein n=1 Tax=Prorocentrum cordatum TaxID=2364126 RepID=A0ABN9T2Y8_9DINO|nr:unnamed protein product [Polarella glacialis]